MSKHGDPLLAPEAVAVVRDRLLPLATVATPNLLEVEQLTGVRYAARATCGRPPPPCWRSGRAGCWSRAATSTATPSTCSPTGEPEEELRCQRFDNRHTHGTGCTLASAIAAGLACGRTCRRRSARPRPTSPARCAAGFPLGAGSARSTTAGRCATGGPLGPTGRIDLRRVGECGL